MIDSLCVLDGAREFLDELRRRTQVVILSDTFEQFAGPFMRQLGMPTILCHTLVVADDRIVDYRLRLPDQKRGAVEAFRALNYRVVAGRRLVQRRRDARRRRRRRVVPRARRHPRAVPAFPACDGYDQLLDAIDAALVG